MKIRITDTSGNVLYEGTPPLVGDGISIGSAKNCDIQIRRLGISPKHLQLRLDAEGCATVQDLQSPFGISIDGEKIAPGLGKTVPHGGSVALSDEIILHLEPDQTQAVVEKQSLSEVMNSTIFPFFLHQNELFVQRIFTQLIGKVPPPHHGAIRACQGEIAQKVRELSAILEVSFGLNSIVTFQRLLEYTLEMALAVTGVERGFISIHNEESDRLETAAIKGMTRQDIERDIPATSGPVNAAFRDGKTFAGPAKLADVSSGGRHPADYGIQSLAVTPLKVMGTSIGVLYLDSKRHANLFSEKTQNLLKVFATQAAVAIHRARMLHVATTDELTGASNQKHFHQRLLEEFCRSRRHRKPLSLVLFDLDGFRQINEQHGEQTGDRLLKQIGRILRSSKRVHDLVSRIGPDEFAVVLPETPRDGAGIMAEKLRSLIAQTSFKIGRRTLTVTASFGLASSTGATKKIADLINLAERAVARARKAGGNQVALARQPMHTERSRNSLTSVSEEAQQPK